MFFKKEKGWRRMKANGTSLFRVHLEQIKLCSNAHLTTKAQL